MSKTLNLDPKRLIVYYSANVLSIIAGGKHRRFFAEQVGEDRLRDIYNIAKSFKEGSAEAGERLAKFLDAGYREEVGDGLVTDMYGNYYLTDLPHHPIPATVRAMFNQYIEEGLDLTPIMNLWKLALDNPSEQARRDLMSYIDKFGVPVTDSGYMILYKSVRDKNEVIEKLAFFVGQEYFEKMRYREDPANYWVYEMPDNAAYREESPRFFIHGGQQARCEVVPEEGANRKKFELWYTENPANQDYGALPDALTESYDDAMERLEELGGSHYDRDAILEVNTEVYTEVTLEPVGNLKDLFRELVIDKQDVENDDQDSEPVFEPYHSGKYGMTIKLGEVVTMPRESCDPDITVDCSYGLHVGSYEYVSRFGRGDGSVLACLVNPRDIVALPQYDHSKIRTCAYMPYGVIKTTEDGDWEEVEASYWEEDFIGYEKAVLEQRIASLREQMEYTEDEPSKVKMEELSELLKTRLVTLDN